MPPDPKPKIVRIRPSHKTRIVNPAAIIAKCLAERECRICGLPCGSGHHLIKRSQGGDDVEDNIIPLCGSGTSGCHGKVEDRDLPTMMMLGAALKPPEIEYVRLKMGRDEGDEWLFVTFRLLVPVEDVG